MFWAKCDKTCEICTFFVLYVTENHTLLYFYSREILQYIACCYMDTCLCECSYVDPVEIVFLICSINWCWGMKWQWFTVIKWSHTYNFDIFRVVFFFFFFLFFFLSIETDSLYVILFVISMFRYFVVAMCWRFDILSAMFSHGPLVNMSSLCLPSFSMSRCRSVTAAMAIKHFEH